MQVNLQRSISSYALEHHELVLSMVLLYVLGLGAFLPTLKTDMDLENLLPESAMARVFHEQATADFGLHPAIILGITNDQDPNGVFSEQEGFGQDMLTQTALGLCLGLALILALLCFLLRRFMLVLALPAVVAVSVISTLGIMAALGISLNLMTSFVPFCIALTGVVYATCILSEYIDSDSQGQGCRRTMKAHMDCLSSSLLYASQISAAGFVSWGLLSSTAWVRALGICMAFGVMVSWLCAVSLVPAYAVLLQRCLPVCTRTPVIRPARTYSFLRSVACVMRARARYVLVSVAALMGVAAYGVTKISFNDSPAQWFKSTQSLGKAQAELNSRFNGSSQAYLVFEDKTRDTLDPLYLSELREALLTHGEDLRQVYPHAMSLVGAMEKTMLKRANKEHLKVDFLEELSVFASAAQRQAPGVDAIIWQKLTDFWRQKRSEMDLFKDPNLLRYIAALQDHLSNQRLTVQSRSLADIVKDMQQTLPGGRRPKNRSIPDSSVAVGQCLSQFQGGYAADELWHFVTRDFKKTCVRFQLGHEGCAAMEGLQKASQAYVDSHPIDMEMNWAGLPAIYSAWQQSVLQSVPKALIGSLMVMFLVMALRLRSALWAGLGTTVLCLPTAVVYGAVGLTRSCFGIYMACFSMLTLGLSALIVVQYLVRVRTAYRELGSWQQSIAVMSEAPARTMLHALAALALGSLALLAHSLVPFRILGGLMAAIAVLLGLTVLFVLPVVITAIKPLLPESGPRRAYCAQAQRTMPEDWREGGWG